MGGAEVLSSEQQDLLTAILNRIIPAEGDLLGAGDLGLVDFVEKSVSSRSESRRLFLDGITEVEVAAWHQGASTFRALEIDRQDEVLRQVEASRPEFFNLLVERTYQGYYVDPRVLTALGHDPRPPQPRGHELPAFDASVLDRVRARGPIFRLVPR
ncbi:MAG TPA: gluconate 2-dehydrogenase subunit 3 family protein [Chloroflexota bacterium]|nr:gluconate 2-dehydrogenase subunit 3 family protein [Chloroflexota bacterium]